jgi:hypothetical protein
MFAKTTAPSTPNLIGGRKRIQGLLGKPVFDIGSNDAADFRRRGYGQSKHETMSTAFSTTQAAKMVVARVDVVERPP